GDVRFAKRFGVLALITYLPESRTDDGRAGFGLTAGTLAGCYAIISGERDALDACAGPELGALHSVVYEKNPKTPGDQLWLAATGSVRGTIELEAPVLLELGLTLGVPLIQREFVVKGESGRVFRPSSVVGHAFVGIGMFF